MLVLVLEISRISAPTLYHSTDKARAGSSRDGRPRGAPSKERRSSKTEDESPDLRGRHLTGTVRGTNAQDRKPQWLTT